MLAMYVLVSNNVFLEDGAIETKVLGVFDNFDTAKEEMQKEIQTTIEDFKDYETEEDSYSKDGYEYWAIWEKEYFTGNHYEIFIQRARVR
jgi:hypothetical protein